MRRDTGGSRQPSLNRWWRAVRYPLALVYAYGALAYWLGERSGRRQRS